MNLPNPAELLPQMAGALINHLNQRQISQPRFIGIRTGGVWVAQALMECLGNREPLGILDVSFYRDDFTQNVVGATLSLATDQRIKLSATTPLTLELQTLAN